MVRFYSFVLCNKKVTIDCFNQRQTPLPKRAVIKPSPFLHPFLTPRLRSPSMKSLTPSIPQPPLNTGALLNDDDDDDDVSARQ